MELSLKKTSAAPEIITVTLTMAVNYFIQHNSHVDIKRQAILQFFTPHMFYELCQLQATLQDIFVSLY